MESNPITHMEYDDQVFLQGLRQAAVASLDTETTGLSVLNGRDYLQGFSVAFRAGGMLFSHYFPVRHKEDNYTPDIIHQAVEILKTKELVFHNRKFDLHSLNSAGWNFEGIYAYDTMLLAHLVNEEYPRSKSLENCARQYINKGKVQKDEMDRFTSVFGWDAVPPSLMSKYACGDAEVTLELFEELWKRFTKQFGEDAVPLWNVELGQQTALYKMEKRGVGVDLKFCRQYASIAEIEMDQIEDDLGFKPSKTTDLAKFLFDDLSLPVLERTPTGKPSMTKAVMEEYDRMLEQDDDPRARLVLNYRGWQKASSTFYKPFQTLVDSNGHIHCNYKQHGTVTGRLSCAEPNLQQIPRSSDKVWNGKIRTAFRASPGFSLVGFDYSQLELRLAAAYGQEAFLIEEFAKPDADPFTRYSEIIGADRYTTKTFFYAMIYGAGKEKIAKTLNKSVHDISDQYDAFIDAIPGIIRAKKLAETKAKQRGYIRYWTGRRRHFRNPNDTYKAFNALLQGGGAEVVKRVMYDWDKEYGASDDCRLLLQVHDELVFEIVSEQIDKWSSSIVALMQDIPTDFFKVPFIVHGKEWGSED